MGPETATLVALIMRARPRPEQGYRSCLGIMRLNKQYGAERLEAASARAVAVGVRSYRHVAAILKNGLDWAAAGAGKSYIACALAYHACRRAYKALYHRASRLFHELRLTRADGIYHDRDARNTHSP